MDEKDAVHPLAGPPEAEDDNPIPAPLQLSHDWSAIRHWYFTEGLRQERERRVSLNEVADEFHVPQGYLRKVAAREEWSIKLSEMIKQRDLGTASRIRELAVSDEFNLRLRQARNCQLAAQKAMAKLATLEPEDMSTKDAINLLRLALQEERRAMGIPDEVSIQSKDSDGDEQLKAVKKAKEILGRLKAKLEADDRIEGEFTEVPNDDGS